MPGNRRARPFPLAFKAQGRELSFDGFLRVYEEPDDLDEIEDEDENTEVPVLKEGQSLNSLELPIDDHQTRPPSRFTEAALVQPLEALGVGRPSTFASMVAIIQSRKYATLKQKRLAPTESGIQLCDFLVERFPQVFNTGYTAQLEDRLDQVASGQSTPLWRSSRLSGEVFSRS